MRRPTVRNVKWVSGIVWTASWLFLYLEIFYWQHVTTTLRLNPPKVPPGYPQPQPGGFVLAVLAGSALAPPVFLLAAITARVHQKRTTTGVPSRIVTVTLDVWV